jgi:membrane fusion protein, heavy metal efflux system
MKILRLTCVQHGFLGLLMLVVAILPADLSAHEGHDHEEEAALAQAAAPLAGREVLELTSDLYEAVIERRTDKLRIYLDLYETNEPVADARIAVDFGAAQGLIAAQKAPGQYEVALKAAAAEESVPVTLTIQSSAGDDLLGGTFDAPVQDEHSWFEELGHWLEHYALWLLAAALLVGVALFLRRRSRAAAVSASAWILAGAALLSLSDVQAHEGHDHEDELAAMPVPADSGTRPMRLPDGSLFVPKVTQRILAVRTTVTREGSAPLTVRLAGEITGDPRASAAVQTLQGGRVASGDAAWPVLGASVRRGQTLLRLTPTGSGTERAGAAAERARVESDLSLARAELARLESLSGIVAPVEVDTARARVASLQAQRAAFGATLGSGEVLRAPIDGVIAAMNAAPGAIAQPTSAGVRADRRRRGEHCSRHGCVAQRSENRGARRRRRLAAARGRCTGTSGSDDGGRRCCRRSTCRGVPGKESLDTGTVLARGVCGPSGQRRARCFRKDRRRTFHAARSAGTADFG